MNLNLVQALPDGETLINMRRESGISPMKICDGLGYTYRMYCLKESGEQALNIGEINLLLIMFGKHPHWSLCGSLPLERIVELMIPGAPSSEDVRAVRVALGLKPKEIAAELGYKHDTWRSKESPAKAGTLKMPEYNLLRLILGDHPNLKIQPK